MPDADVLSISPSGEMAISLQHRFKRPWESTGTLAQIPLTGGVPREILARVKHADWAPDGRGLAIVRAMGGRERLEFPVGNLLYESDGFMIIPRVAPNGDRVAFLERAGGQESVVIVSAAGERTIVAARQNDATGLAWSASGSELVFTVVRNGRYDAACCCARPRPAGRDTNGRRMEAARHLARGARVTLPRPQTLECHGRYGR